jgi:hypothetical protein
VDAVCTNAYIDIGFAESAVIARDARAGEGGSPVDARPAVATGIGGAFIDIRLTARTGPPVRTRAQVTV